MHTASSRGVGNGVGLFPSFRWFRGRRVQVIRQVPLFDGAKERNKYKMRKKKERKSFLKGHEKAIFRQKIVKMGYFPYLCINFVYRFF